MRFKNIVVRLYEAEFIYVNLLKIDRKTTEIIRFQVHNENYRILEARADAHQRACILIFTISLPNLRISQRSGDLEHCHAKEIQLLIFLYKIISIVKAIRIV